MNILYWFKNKIKSNSFCLILTLPFFISVYYFCISNLAQWDTLGHYIAAQNYKDSIFPFFSGWNSHHFVGYPQGYFYPSLFHWLIGGLGRLINLKFLFKMIISLNTLITPYCIFYFCKNYYSDEVKSKVATLAMVCLYFIPKNHMGGDLLGVFRIGLVNQNWAMNIFYLYFGQLFQVTKKNIYSKICSGVLLGLLILSHAFVTLAAGIISLFYVFFKKEEGDVVSFSVVRKFYLIPLIALLISAVWWAPFLMYKQYGAGIGFSLFSNIFPDFRDKTDSFSYLILILFLLISFLISLFKEKKYKLKFSLSTIFFIFLIGFAADFLSESHLFQIYSFFPLHLYRLQYFVLILGCLILADFDSIKTFYKKYNKYIIFFITGLSIFFNFRVIKSTHTEFNLGFNIFEMSNALVYQGTQLELSNQAPHFLADSVRLSGVDTINGLFAESSLNAAYYMTMLSETFKDVFVWGGYPVPPASLQIAKHLNIYGLDSIISRKKITQQIKMQLPIVDQVEDLKTELIIDGKFYNEKISAYKLKSTKVDWIKDYRFVDANWNNEVLKWWISNEKDYLINGKAEEEYLYKQVTGPKKIEYRSVNSEEINLFIDSSQPVWILLKQSYFPNWSAYNKNGLTVPLLKSAPNLIAIYGNGEIKIIFKRSLVEKISSIISLFFLCLSCLYLLFDRKYKKKVTKV